MPCTLHNALYFLHVMEPDPSQSKNSSFLAHIPLRSLLQNGHKGKSFIDWTTQVLCSNMTLKIICYLINPLKHGRFFGPIIQSALKGGKTKFLDFFFKEASAKKVFKVNNVQVWVASRYFE